MLNKVIASKIKRTLTVGEFNELIDSLNKDSSETIKNLLDRSPDEVEAFIEDVKQIFDNLYDLHDNFVYTNKDILVKDAKFIQQANTLSTFSLAQIKSVLVDLTDDNSQDDGALIAEALIQLLEKKMPPSDFFALANESALRRLFKSRFPSKSKRKEEL